MHCNNCALGFHNLCRGTCSCDHLPTDPLLLAVHTYNGKAKKEGFKPIHLRFDDKTPFGVLMAAAASCRLKLPAESSILFQEGLKRKGPITPRPRPQNHQDKSRRSRKRDKHERPQKELALQ